MMQHAKKSESSQFVVATETGIMYRMKKENQTKCSYQLRKMPSVNI